MEERPRNIALLIEYDGELFCGWQTQPKARGPSVQRCVEEALEKALGKKTIIYGCSRTDSGVHALGQVANFFTTATIRAKQWAHLLNHHLPREIRIQESKEMPLEFIAQKQVVSKTYAYRLMNRKIPSALDRRAYFYSRPLDWAAIREAAPLFLGTHDFKAFQGAKSSRRTTVRTIYRLDIHEDEANGIVTFWFEGSGFLKQMIRAMMGTLIFVGEGKLKPQDLPKILASCDRRRAGFTAPPEGLCLVDIRYPFEVFCRSEVNQRVNRQSSKTPSLSGLVPLAGGAGPCPPLESARAIDSPSGC